MYIYTYIGVLGFLSPPFPSNIPNVLESPTYQRIEICTDIKEEFERIYIRVNAYNENKTTNKTKQQPKKPLGKTF